VEWQIQISREFDRWLRLWEARHPGFRCAIVQRLDQAAADPDNVLHRVVGATADLWACYADAPARTGGTLFVTLYFRRRDAERMLRVESGRAASRQNEAPPEDGLS
jgi:hypothetical protein